MEKILTASFIFAMLQVVSIFDSNRRLLTFDGCHLQFDYLKMINNVKCQLTVEITTHNIH